MGEQDLLSQFNVAAMAQDNLAVGSLDTVGAFPGDLLEAHGEMPSMVKQQNAVPFLDKADRLAGEPQCLRIGGFDLRLPEELPGGGGGRACE